MVFFQEWLRKWYFIPLLVLISALAYLPNISHFGYFRDDWYLMYSANALGVKTFEGIFAIDRPVRTILMTGLYSMFGMNPLYYNISAYVLRVLGAFAFLWTLRLLWPRQRTATTLAALFFLIYPGFLSTPNAIDYQEKYVGLLLGHLSIALSVKAVLAAKNTHKILLWFPAVLLGGIYPTFVEYYLGLEVFRLLAIGLLVTRQQGINLSGSIRATLYRWLPFSISPLSFVIWRFFIFDSDRRATDLGAQLKMLVDSPLLVGVGWMVALLKNSLEVVLFSWGFPLVNLWDTPLRLREMMYAGILVSLAMLSISLFLKLHDDVSASEAGNTNWRKEALWIGMICAVTGFVPVILSNREADFYNYSRYMLPSSSGAVIVLAAVLDQFSARTLRNILICLLVGFATLTHHFNGLQWARSNDGMQDFWWQVSWRIPQLQPGTTLVVNYSHAAVEEDYFIWGPANLIFHPQSMDAEMIRPALSGAVLTRASVVSILTEAEPVSVNRRTILTTMDYGNILILTQPTSASCVQVIDGEFPVLSEVEQYDISLVAGASDPKNIILNTQSPLPLQIVFGSEPEHDWCFYYQTASLAYQRGDWHTVVNLGQKARRMGFSAGDAVEWMPFLQGATLLGDRDEILLLAPKIKKSEFLALQACRVLAALPGLDEDSRSFVVKIFCEAGR
jgi:hypothetical protein